VKQNNAIGLGKGEIARRVFLSDRSASPDIRKRVALEIVARPSSNFSERQSFGLRQTQQLTP
jgi:hypothetical protein